MMPLAPKILYEDTHLIVISKPPGLLSQGARPCDENLVDWLRNYLGRNYIGLVHRLDRNTSGIMLVAKRSKSAERLTKALQAGKIYRSYLAWLIGDLKDEENWIHWLTKDKDKNIVVAYPSAVEGAKEARLRVIPMTHVSYCGGRLTLAQFVLETGRSHQIRVQAAQSGYPVLGDTKYAKRDCSCPFTRPALHSFQLRFEHPMTQEKMAFEDPMPEDMKGLLPAS